MKSKFILFILFTFCSMLSFNVTGQNLKTNQKVKPVKLDTTCIETFYFKQLVDNVQNLFDHNGLLKEENVMLNERIIITDSLYSISTNKFKTLDSLYNVEKTLNDQCKSDMKSLVSNYNGLHANFIDCYNKHDVLKQKNKKNKLLYLGIGVITGITFTSLILK
jgi:hypothetical protein